MKKIVSSMVLVSMLMAVSSVVMAAENKDIYTDGWTVDNSEKNGTVSNRTGTFAMPTGGVIGDPKIATDSIPIYVGIDFEPGQIKTVYDVAIEYDELLFTYEVSADEFAWNPAKHLYTRDASKAKETPWSEAKEVKVSNHSNADVEVEGFFLTGEGTEVKTLTKNGVTITATPGVEGTLPDDYDKQLERADVSDRYSAYASADSITYSLEASGELKTGTENVLDLYWLPEFTSAKDGYKVKKQFGGPGGTSGAGNFNIRLTEVPKAAPYSEEETT